ncbi:Inositol monophosphatase 1 [Sarcoptes scabiei]|nr:Inositol monophosphatase 1 [Sarcoptes scabiei]
MDEMGRYLQYAIKLAREAGQMMIEWREKNSFSIASKSSPTDLVTEVDIKIERFIFDSLRSQFPDHKFVGEESVANVSSEITDDPTWIVDPIDGTMNFIHQSPWCAVSIALAINRQSIVGVINCPFIGRLYHASLGRGAFMNDKPIKVSSRAKSIDKALILNDFWPKLPNDLLDAQHCLFWKSQGVRSLGSACVSMCLVADGSADAFYHFRLKVWDVAAGSVIITEAGGEVRQLNNQLLDLNCCRNVLTGCCNEIIEAIVNTLNLK